METQLNRPRVLSMRPFVLLVVCIIATHSAYAQAPIRDALPAPAKGSAAIAALGRQLPDVARAYGVDPQRLTVLFQMQPSLGVDRHGLLVFACAAPAGSLAARSTGEAPTQESATSATTSGALVPENGDALRLHSFPGAQRVIYLDFNGHTTSGTPWNANLTGGAAINSQPFDLDGSPSSFNATELALIRGVWRRVAEDYAPFAVDVTTEDPGVEALRRSGANDAAFGIRVVISPTNWYTDAGGVGYVGSFDWSSDTPCFVFAQQLANSEKNIAEAAAHEAGHTLGLYHDGQGGAAATEYYLGHGNWAPIMGAGYYRSVTQFSRGEYADANQKQDDLAVIATFMPYAADDHGGTTATATTLSGPAISDGGTIERNTDVDVFRFTTGAGNISLRVQGPSAQPNLDVLAELLDANGQVLQSVDSWTLAAAIDTTLAAGTYYLRVSGVGADSPVTNGYSRYGSLGNYVITGSLAAGTTTNQRPTAVASAAVTAGAAPLAVAFSSTGSTDADGTIAGYHWNFGDGATSTSAYPSHTYTSPGSFTALLTVTDNLGLTATASVAISVSAGGADVAPTITSQPASQTVPPGGSVVFTVVATGAPTPTVRWYRDGLTWSGWTGSSLAINGASANDAGTYTAVVSNSAGSVTSAAATLTIGSATPPPPPSTSAPTITQQPVSQTVAAGTSVTLSGAASGSPAPTYQWRKDGTPIAGATGATLALGAVTSSHAGSYTLVATNSAGSATSNVAVLTVTSGTGVVAPTITTSPQSQTAAWGATVTLTVAATGSPAPTFQWYRNGQTWASWTGASLTLTGVTPNDNGTYTAVATNSAGSVTSAPATLTVQ